MSKLTAKQALEVYRLKQQIDPISADYFRAANRHLVEHGIREEASAERTGQVRGARARTPEQQALLNRLVEIEETRGVTAAEIFRSSNSLRLREAADAPPPVDETTTTKTAPAVGK